jgi:hypothetical protein
LLLLMDAQVLRESATDAIGYWERRRLVYNVALAAIVLVDFGIYYPASKTVLSLDFALSLFLLAVLANVAYCAAYVVDIFAQASAYREQWRKYRWVVFIIGMLFAGVITRFFARSMFQPESIVIH